MPINVEKNYIAKTDSNHKSLINQANSKENKECDHYHEIAVRNWSGSTSFPNFCISSHPSNNIIIFAALWWLLSQEPSFPNNAVISFHG